ncbi:tectonic-2 isoform X2 [Protopterus annectens]|uniref:tectonic-2 isoform X2 n=1 Tax=Protopterus annectens TaxID=7888 RepID=UPI001CFA67E3|nr:tectonic-2 isoform X2 [Protopterus annectens]
MAFESKSTWDNATVIPNQVYQTLGSCPCSLTSGACDIRCCCDEDCSKEAKQLFSQQCYMGIFGGNVTPAFDQLCSVQAVENEPDWFPFLCVHSSLQNTPYLGLFYQGSTIDPDPAPSFQRTVQNIQPPLNGYRQGDPIFTTQHQYFTISQNSVSGQCLTDAPVAFLQNFNANCLTRLSAPDFSSVQLNNGFGENILITVVNRTEDKNEFISIPSQAADLSSTQPSIFSSLQTTVLGTSSAPQANESCKDFFLAADFTFYWQANSITNVSVTVTYGNVCPLEQGSLTQRFSATFISVMTNPNQINETRSGNPGYQKNKPVIAINGTTVMRTTLNLWQPVGKALCDSVSTTPVLFGVDATSGCLFKLGAGVLNCSVLRETISMSFSSLVNVTHVAKRGNSDLTDPSEWVEVIHNTTQSTSNTTDHSGLCSVPANLNIHIITAVIGAVEGVLQEAILGVKISFSTVTWQLQCGGAAVAECQNASSVQLFPVSTSVQFTRIPAQSPPPITSFQMNYTEYDCNRNEVCWPQLAYPLTTYYTGESYSQSIAKGMILVFFFITAAILGSPWNKIRQAWNNTTF